MHRDGSISAHTMVKLGRNGAAKEWKDPTWLEYSFLYTDDDGVEQGPFRAAQLTVQPSALRPSALQSACPGVRHQISPLI